VLRTAVRLTYEALGPQGNRPLINIKMKKTSIFLACIFVSTACLSAAKIAIKKEQKQENFSEGKPSSKVEHKNTAPVGIGPIRIGMSKDAALALQKSDGVYLTAPLEEHTDKYISPKPGTVTYSAMVKTPNSEEPLNLLLTFEGDRLKEIFINFEQSPYLFEKFKSQIIEKYGPGLEKDERKEKQCIYKSGANFKINPGTVATIWTYDSPDGSTIETRFADFNFKICPVNLIDGTVDFSNTKSLSIHSIEKAIETKNSPIF
jgi:hypothetical protein